MHLKTLTLRGFKSFASSTTLRFEPGVTCVVGANGSGKSNVVDALAWVMGEQGAKTLRGGKMEDVIFAGTAGRPPLGRAEVVLTIDNSDHALPIDYAEVTISRTMFRNGGSEYAINGQHSRLLDVQELLSDSGIGREMHVIVGQGQLDAILAATPEDRRGFVEEAAGVLKHRKRKEKALRKLDSMAANLTRLQDLTAELKRHLKPLARQAEVARRAQVVQADARDARLRLLADDLVQLESALAQDIADETALVERQAALSAALTDARREEAELEERARAASPALTRAQETWYALSALRERLRGTAALAAERVRQSGSPVVPVASGRDPDALAVEAADVRRHEAELLAAVTSDRAALQRAVDARAGAEQDAAAATQRHAARIRDAADRREALVRLSGQVDSLRTRAVAAAAELERLGLSRDEATARAEQAQQTYAARESTIAGLSVGEEGLDAEHAAAEAELAAAEQALEQVRAAERTAEQQRAALAARVEALSLGLTRRDGAGALLAADDRVSGLLGSVAALLQVQPGAEVAVAAALGAAADAVAVASVESAVDALRLLRDEDLGRAGLVVAADGSAAPRSGWPELPGGHRYAVDLVTAPPSLVPALSRLLGNVAVVDDLAAARALVEAAPDVVAVTRDGDLLGTHLASGGSSGNPSLIEVQAAADEAAEALAAATHEHERLRFALHEAAERREAAAGDVAASLTRLHESDAGLSAVADELGRLGQAARGARAEAERLQRTIADAEAARDRDLGGLAELESRLAAAQVPGGDDGDGPTQPDPADRERAEARARDARHAETDARLALRTGEERLRALTGRAEHLERAEREERTARATAEFEHARRVREVEVARVVAAACAVVLDRLDASLATAADVREQAQAAAAQSETGLGHVRTRLRELAAQLDEITDVVHRDELARAELRLRIDALRDKAAEEHGVPAADLVEDYGPATSVPPSPLAPGDEEDAAPAEEREPRPYVRMEQEKRLRDAERQLALLGRVNPLALEEFAALEERYRLLTEQLRDLEATRRDLLDIVRDVDERVEQVFAAAYADVAREFESTFARLFPGGTGRLLLTEPRDLLTTGIEVEARPPGKKVKRLSLLSGGERSLVAVAFLVALFKARPSPFYILDEVEAALDEINLGRLIELYDELRENSQLIVITHQKRTMEIADALYGVSMRGDGVTAVISQRLREAELV